MLISKANIALALLGLSGVRAQAQYESWLDVAKEMGLMQRRNLKQNTSPATHSSISATDADSAPDLRHLQAGVQVFTTKSSFEEYGGAAAEAASGNCEGFENSLPAISGEFPGRYCSSNPISSGDLGGCMTSMKDGIKVGTTELLTGVYAPGTPLVLIDPILTAIFGLTTSRGVAPYFAVDEAFIEFEGVNALSFEVVNAFASADSVTLDIWDVNGNPLGSIPAGADFVGIVSDTPIGRITLPAGPSTLEFLDNICFEPSSVTGETGGDPHFRTFSGGWYDYMGACDLTLLQAPNFAANKELIINIRTKIRYEFSYIEQVVLKIGDETLEVGSFGEYSLNGVHGASNATMAAGIAGFPISYSQPNKKTHIFEIHLGDGEKIVLRTFKDLVSVKMDELHSSRFAGSKGMMGSFDDDGAMLGRDGTTVFEDPNAFASEWQVREDEPMMFQTIQEPQHPQACLLPAPQTAANRQRRLGESVAREAAEKACASWDKEKVEMCVHDVLATGDLDLALTGAF